MSPRLMRAPSGHLYRTSSKHLRLKGNWYSISFDQLKTYSRSSGYVYDSDDSYNDSPAGFYNSTLGSLAGFSLARTSTCPFGYACYITTPSSFGNSRVGSNYYGQKIARSCGANITLEATVMRLTKPANFGGFKVKVDGTDSVYCELHATEPSASQIASASTLCAGNSETDLSSYTATIKNGTSSYFWLVSYMPLGSVSHNYTQHSWTNTGSSATAPWWWWGDDIAPGGSINYKYGDNTLEKQSTVQLAIYK